MQRKQLKITVCNSVISVLFVSVSEESFSDLIGDAANEKNNFAKKVEISAQHIEWLKENQTLLNILLNYCTLHGACGGDVASTLKYLLA
jgi:hypothetical protein